VKVSLEGSEDDGLLLLWPRCLQDTCTQARDLFPQPPQLFLQGRVLLMEIFPEDPQAAQLSGGVSLDMVGADVHVGLTVAEEGAFSKDKAVQGRGFPQHPNKPLAVRR
jgi:hypothetical protein